MNINMNDHIGAIHMNVLTGRWSIVGASDKMNEEFDYRMQNNSIYCDRDKFMNETSTRLVVEGVAITSENYADYRKPTGVMPKHCYGTDYGHKQNEKIQQNLKDYYLAQTVTKEELKDFFKDCCKDMRVILAQERKTTGLDADNNRQIILDTYEMFRMANSVMANLGCGEEGKKLARENGWKDGQDIDWVYYSADFYYESEELRDLFKGAAQEIAEEWECGKADTTEWDRDVLANYSSSFNEVWKNGSEYGARICSMLDVSKEPPKGFCLFFREFMGEKEHEGIVQAGVEGGIDIKKKVIFDVFGKYDQHPQFYHLKELLSNVGNGSAFEEYLDNFDIYTRYYGTARMRD